jgi:hypothetical protein
MLSLVLPTEVIVNILHKADLVLLKHLPAGSVPKTKTTFYFIIASSRQLYDINVI